MNQRQVNPNNVLPYGQKAAAQNAPFSQEAEEAVIGAVLVNPSKLASVALFLKPEDFFLLRNQYIWAALLRLHERREAIDYLLLIEELRAANQLEGIGGEVYIIGLSRNTPSSMHAEAYGRLVERAAGRRRMMAHADKTRGLALNPNMSLDEAIKLMSSDMLALTRPVVGKSTKRIGEALNAYYDNLEGMREGRLQKRGVPTGYRDLDVFTGGYQRGEVTLVGGRTGAGKTPFLVGSMLEGARLGLRTIFVSLERSRDQIIEILLSMETGIPTDKMRNNELTDGEYERIVEAMGRLGSLSMHIIDAEDLEGEFMTPQQLALRVEQIALETGVDTLFVDYMQLLWAGEGYETESARNIAACAWRLKALCKRLDCAGVAASQYNRTLTKTNKRPTLNFLHGGSGLEKSASLVLHIYDDETEKAREIIVDKNRYGKQETEEGQIHLGWVDYCQKFSNYNPVLAVKNH